jgi:hypothetical protein
MKVSTFRDTLDELTSTNSRNEKKRIIREVSDSPAAISFLSGSEYDDAGLGKRTVLSVAQDVYGESVDGKPTVSKSLEQYDGSSDDFADSEMTLRFLRTDMQTLSDLSGNEMKEKLEELFIVYDYPSVVAFACLNDLNTGCSDKTIANALNWNESLPFYEGVHAIAEDEEPQTEPEVGQPFSPQLAVPESRSPDFVEE